MAGEGDLRDVLGRVEDVRAELDRQVRQGTSGHRGVMTDHPGQASVRLRLVGFALGPGRVAELAVAARVLRRVEVLAHGAPTLAEAAVQLRRPPVLRRRA